jgi:hypothetical protein
MAANTPTLTDAEKTRWLRKLDRATASYEKARRALDETVAEARQAGMPLTAISEHSPYSREWVRTITARIQAARPDEESSPSE